LDLNQIEEDDSLESFGRIVQSRTEDGRDPIYIPDLTPNLNVPDSPLQTVPAFNESTPAISNFANISRIPRTIMMPTSGSKVRVNSFDFFFASLTKILTILKNFYHD